MINFDALLNSEQTYAELAATVSQADLQPASDAQIDRMLALLDGLSDADVTFDPVDTDANDPYAAAGEETIGWSLAHLIAHVTASSEEGAAFSSVLARGVALTERPRYETPWRDLDTHAKCIQRLEESRRIRNAYLMTWPDTPHLDVQREGMSDGFLKFLGGKLNAVGCFVLGLGHEAGHLAQMEAVRAQALAARRA